MKKSIHFIKLGAILFIILELVFYLITRNILLPNGFLLFGINIKVYGLVIASSVAIGYTISRHLAKLREYNLDDFDTFFLFTMILGTIGARIGFVLFDDGAKSFHQIIAISQGGLSIQGAVLGGLLGAYLYRVSFHKKVIDFLNILMPNLLIAQAIGRLGNYFNQELFGIPTTSRLGMKIAEINIPLQYFGSDRFVPTFLVEGILLVVAYLIYLQHHRRYNGIKYYLIAYGSIRFIVQFLRTDHQNIVGFLDFPQIISLLMIVFALIIFRNKPVSKKITANT